MNDNIKDILESAFEEIQELINNDFDSNIAPLIVKEYGVGDQCAIDESYNNHTDSLCKEGVIPDYIYNELTHDDYEDSDWARIADSALKL